MGYVINSEGKKIKVNNPDGYCAENVILINDDTILTYKYLIRLVSFSEGIVAEELLDEEPSDEIIMYYMSKNNVNRYAGYAEVVKVRTLDFRK